MAPRRGLRYCPPVTQSRLYPTRPFLAASVAVFRQGKALLGARARPPLEGVYSLPGGLVEAGEKLEEAALRELREETGVEARIIGATGAAEVIRRDDDGRVRSHFVVLSYAARWLSGEGLPNHELRHLVWVDAHGAAALTLTPGLSAILERGFARAGA